MNGVLEKIFLFLLEKVVDDGMIEKFKAQLLANLKKIVDAQPDPELKAIEAALYEILVKVLGG